MRTPPLIRTLEAVPRVSGIEGFHCNIIIVRYIQYTDIVHTTAHILIATLYTVCFGTFILLQFCIYSVHYNNNYVYYRCAYYYL